jgi:hypothetical protein
MPLEVAQDRRPALGRFAIAALKDPLGFLDGKALPDALKERLDALGLDRGLEPYREAFARLSASVRA